MAKSRQSSNQLLPVKRSRLPEYGELVSIMQNETASIISDYIRQYIGVYGTSEPGSGIFINFDRILNTQSYQELAWYDLYQEIERDPQVLAVMTSAKLDVAGIPWDMSAHLNNKEKKPTARNQAVADFVKEAISGIGYFPQHLYNLMDALGKGFAVSEIVWKVGDDGVTVDRILNRPQRRFQFDAVDRSLRLRNINQPYFGTALPDRKFIVHRVSAEWENPFGDALDQSIYWMWLFKRTVIKFWMQHLEVGAASVPIVKHPSSANPEMKNEALAIARQIRSGAYGRIPDNFEIEWAEAKNAIQNAQTYELFEKMCDEQISKAVQGQTLTTDTGTSGTRAQGDVHRDTADSRDLFRAHGLEATLNATLIPWLCDFNFADLDGYPQFRFDLEESEDLAKEATIIKTLSDAGYEFDLEELSGKFNYTLTKKSAIGGGGELGKLPLAIQQLALARTRAEESGDQILSKQIGDKINELLNSLNSPIDPAKVDEVAKVAAENQSKEFAELRQELRLLQSSKPQTINITTPPVNVHIAPNPVNVSTPAVTVNVPKTEFSPVIKQAPIDIHIEVPKSSGKFKFIRDGKVTATLEKE